MTPKQSPSVDPLTPDALSVAGAMPIPTGAPTGRRLRCIQRPTGEWFTFALGNAPGKDTPDATELLTETEARQRLEADQVAETLIEEQLATARANPEISADEPPLPDPAVGSMRRPAEPGSEGGPSAAPG